MPTKKQLAALAYGRAVRKANLKKRCKSSKKKTKVKHSYRKHLNEYKETPTDNKILNKLTKIINKFENNKFDVDENEVEQVRSAIENDIQKYEVPTSWLDSDVKSILKQLSTFGHNYNYKLKKLKNISFNEYYNESLEHLKLLWHYYNDVINNAPLNQ